MTTTALGQLLSDVLSQQCFEKFVPLQAHFEAAIRRKDAFLSIPLSVLGTVDKKVLKSCLDIDQNCDKSPERIVDILCRAVTASEKTEVTLSRDWNNFSVSYDKEKSSSLTFPRLWLKRVIPLPSQVLEYHYSQENKVKGCCKSVDMVKIFASQKQNPQKIGLLIPENEYFLSAIGGELGINNAAHLLVSGQIGTVKSGLRFYYGNPSVVKNKEMLKNRVASWLSGLEIYGDVIMAKVGSTYKSKDPGCRFWHENYTLHDLYKLISSRHPEGRYILSRNAPFIARLPDSFTGIENWRGLNPIDLASVEDFFPDATVETSQTGIFWSCSLSIAAQELTFGNTEDLDRLFFQSEKSFRTVKEATHSCWLQLLKKYQENYMEKATKEDHYWHVSWENKIFGSQISSQKGSENMATEEGERGPRPALGSFVNVDYEVSCTSGDNFLISQGKGEGNISKILIESNKGYEFELGTNGVISPLEDSVLKLCCGEITTFQLETSCFWPFLTHDFPEIEPFPDKRIVEIGVKLNKFVEKKEDREECGFFKPSLAAQRQEFVAEFISTKDITTVLDIGCGSGALLKKLVENMKLETLIGVDVSSKALASAKKSIGALLSKPEVKMASNKKIYLFQENLTETSRTFNDFDLVTLIEVIEHLDPEPLGKVGEVVFGSLQPNFCVVSTPNIEFNPILRGQTNEVKIDPMTQKPNYGDLRNDDHRFEWTREEFADWANEITRKYKYSLFFSGVGEVEDRPGFFATQIAVFSRTEHREKGLKYIHNTTGLFWQNP